MHIFVILVLSYRNNGSRRLVSTMPNMWDSHLMDLQLQLPWGSCISYGWLLVCTSRSTNTLPGTIIRVPVLMILIFKECILYYLYCIGVMGLRSRHGAKLKDELAPDVIGLSKTILPVKSLEGLPGGLKSNYQFVDKCESCLNCRMSSNIEWAFSVQHLFLMDSSTSSFLY